MQPHLSQWIDLQRRLADARHQLHEQQNLIDEIDCSQNHTALIMLLSNGLRVFCWLLKQKNALLSRMREYLPTTHQ